MEYIYAVWLLKEANVEINADNLKKVLNSVGIQPNDAMINAVLAAIQGIDFEKIKQESLSVGAPVQVQVAPQPQQQVKQEQPKEEKKEEQALEGLSSLFGF